MAGHVPRSRVPSWSRAAAFRGVQLRGVRLRGVRLLPAAGPRPARPRAAPDEAARRRRDVRSQTPLGRTAFYRSPTRRRSLSRRSAVRRRTSRSASRRVISSRWAARPSVIAARMSAALIGASVDVRRPGPDDPSSVRPARRSGAAPQPETAAGQLAGPHPPFRGTQSPRRRAAATCRAEPGVHRTRRRRRGLGPRRTTGRPEPRSDLRR